MAGISLAQAQTRLTQYMDAEFAVLGGQSYKIADRELRRADLSEIRAGIKHWEAKAIALEQSANGRTRSRTVVTR